MMRTRKYQDHKAIPIQNTFRDGLAMRSVESVLASDKYLRERGQAALSQPLTKSPEWFGVRHPPPDAPNSALVHVLRLVVQFLQASKERLGRRVAGRRRRRIGLWQRFVERRHDIPSRI